MKSTMALPNFLSYVDFQNAAKVNSLHACFSTHMLKNKELLSLNQWHLTIVHTDRTVSFNVSNDKSCYHSDEKPSPAHLRT